VLLAALAVVGSVLVGPSAAVQVAGSTAVPGAAARAAAPVGVALRDHRDVARPGLRRGVREQSSPRTASSVRTTLGHGPAPLTGLLAAAVLLVALTVAGRLPAGALAPVGRRTTACRRDRAPPALALA
jgi:hypothetical protein